MAKNDDERPGLEVLEDLVNREVHDLGEALALAFDAGVQFGRDPTNFPHEVPVNYTEHQWRCLAAMVDQRRRSSGRS